MTAAGVIDAVRRCELVGLTEWRHNIHHTRGGRSEPGEKGEEAVVKLGGLFARERGVG